eukprot:TRINITY_DN3612_c0_g1_i1.p1 TRINITY_DN3612_c0_g1~~TRINITY_DN3612_c0_g1_i1.p1  ORF type:complete len:270 (+),score=37.79 TRINITY_DN3612_c0_g1_i1:265-1074(+)
MKESMEDQAGARNTPRIHFPLPAPHNGREDCWSEGATLTLIEAWGDRYLQLSRGNLRQKDWKEVADAVNGRQNGVKPRKTDIQCKNRIDTLKKKYKVEKSKLAPSKWPFYSRLDLLIGASVPKTHSVITFKPIKPNPNPNLAVYSGGGGGGSSSKSRMNSLGSSESSHGGSSGGNDEDAVFDGGVGKHRRDSDSSEAFGELARAIVRFGEIYERIESSKQQQMMELERQRMEFVKELEYQRMQMFMEAQLELEKMKRPKYASGSNGKKL